MTRALLAAILLTLAACKSGGERGVTGGTAEERAMVNGAFNNMAPYLQARGFPNVRKPSSYRLQPMPTAAVYRGLDGQEAGAFLDGKDIVMADTTTNQMRYGRPLHSWNANHEVTHVLLELGGYGKASAEHDKRAFPDGPFFKHRGRIR
jgi:hypothetical protein